MVLRINEYYGARTVPDFKESVKKCDHLDADRERKERYHEIGREYMKNMGLTSWANDAIRRSDAEIAKK